VTDFTWEEPLTVSEDLCIDEALREMMHAGVHALLVVRGPVITGLITSYDIQGERASRFARRSRYTRRDEIEVGQIMTPWDRVPTLDWQYVRTTHVSDIVRFFHGALATHAVIVEYADQGGMFVRGVISRLRLERQLGYSIDHPERWDITMHLSFRLLVALPLAIVALNARLILLAIKAARTSDADGIIPTKQDKRIQPLRGRSKILPKRRYSGALCATTSETGQRRLPRRNDASTPDVSRDSTGRQ
jgi:CBS domain-containing protein